MTDEAISLTAAAQKFGISLSNLRNAVDSGIVHIYPTTDTRSRYLLSKNEIESKIDLIKKSDKYFFRLSKRGSSQVRSPKPVACEGTFYCMRSNTWVPACKIDNCNLHDKCQEITL